MDEFNERIFQAKSSFYNLEQVERLEAEADHRGPAVSPRNSDLALVTRESLFTFTEETDKDTVSSEGSPLSATPSQGQPSGERL